MESQRKRKLRQRNPLSDRTNTSFSVPVKSTKPKPSFSSPFKKPNPKTANLDVASNRSSVAPALLSTPSPNTRSRRGSVDGEASKPISIVYGTRNPSNKRKERENESVLQRKEVESPSSRTPVDRWKVFLKGKGVDIASSSTPGDTSNEPTTKFTSTLENLDVDSSRSSVAPEFLSTHFPNPLPCHGTVDLEASRKEKENESVIQRKEVDILSSRIPVDKWYTYSKGMGVDIAPRCTSNQREDKGTRVDIASSSIPMDISNEPTIPCKKQSTTKFTTTTENLNVASDPSSDEQDFLSTPFPNTRSRHGTVDLEASRKEKVNESVIQRKEVDTLSSRIPVDRWYTYSKGKGVDIAPSSTSNQREDKEKRVDIASSSIPMDISNEPTIPCKKQPTTKFTTITENLNVASDPSSDAPDFLSTPFPNTRSRHGTVDLEASGPISIVYGLRNPSNKRKKKENELDSPARSVPIKKNDKGKNKGKDKGRDKVDIPSSITPMDRWNKPANSNTIKRKDKSKSTSRVYNTRVKSENPPKAKALSVPCRKKQRAKSSLVNVYKDPAMQDYIKKQNAYFKMIDEFELSEEEVCSSSDS